MYVIEISQNKISQNEISQHENIYYANLKRNKKVTYPKAREDITMRSLFDKDEKRNSYDRYLKNI